MRHQLFRQKPSEPFGQEIVEVPLMLPENQISDLEQLAAQQQLTVAQLLRQIIGNCLVSGPPEGKTPEQTAQTTQRNHERASLPRSSQ